MTRIKDAGPEIRELQKNAGLTDEHMAEKLQVSVGAYKKWKGGTSSIHPIFMETIRAICSEQEEKNA